jgi:hypothetical protein
MIKSRTHFIDVFIGLIENVNDCKVLKKSTFYNKFQHQMYSTCEMNLKLISHSIFGDKGYLLLDSMVRP